MCLIQNVINLYTFKKTKIHPKSKKDSFLVCNVPEYIGSYFSREINDQTNTVSI